MPIESAVESSLALTGTIVGLSHIVQRQAWADAFARLHRAGRAGAFANGAISGWTAWCAWLRAS